MPDAAVRPGRLILVPALITLAITLLRLTGELLHWSPRFFGTAPGGGGALVGISWLPPIFGIYFAVRLARAGQGPQHMLRSVILLVLALALLPLSGYGAVALGVDQHSLNLLLVFAVASIVATVLAVLVWPQLGRALLAYAFAARVPVAVLMLFAVLGSWGTHYDAVTPDFPAMGLLRKWLWIGFVPQMTVWIAFTTAVGALFGLVAGKLASRRTAADA